MRKIIVDHQTWRYKIGRGFVVCRNNDTKICIPIPRLLGITNDEFERARWKKTNNVNVMPRHIADLIRHAYWYLNSSTTTNEIRKHWNRQHIGD